MAAMGEASEGMIWGVGWERTENYHPKAGHGPGQKGPKREEEPGYQGPQRLNSQGNRQTLQGLEQGCSPRKVGGGSLITFKLGGRGWLTAS